MTANIDTTPSSLSELADEATFKEQTKHLLEFSERTQAKASMLFITFDTSDIKLNEQQSKLAIETISKMLLAKARESDIYAHLSGMNFANLSIQTSPQHAETIAAKLKHELSQPIVLADGTSLNLQTKIGIANYPDEGISYTQLMSTAKEAAQ